MCSLRCVVKVLLIIGALNWGIVGFFGFNPVELLGDTVARIVFCVIGLAGLYKLGCLFRNCGPGSSCSSGSGCGCKGSSGSGCGCKSSSGSCQKDKGPSDRR